MITSDKTSSKTVYKTAKTKKPFMKAPLEDLEWLMYQQPAVKTLWLECWVADPFGTRPMQLTSKLKATAFTKAKKFLSDAGLFVFKPEKSIRDGRETTCWMVRNLHGSQVESFWMDNADAAIDNADAAIDNADAASISCETQSQSGSQKPSRSKDRDLLKISLTDHERERARGNFEGRKE